MDLRDEGPHTDSGALWSPVGYAQLFVLLTEGLFVPYIYEESICLICSKPSLLFLPSARGGFVAINKGVTREKQSQAQRTNKNAARTAPRSR